MLSFLKPYLVKEKKQNFFFIISLLLTFLLPLYRISSSPFIILMSIIIIVELVISKGRLLKDLFNQKVYFYFFLYFLFASISLSYSQNLNHGINQINKLLPLVIFPLWFLIWKPTKQQIILILKLFVLGCLAAFMLSIFSQFWNVLSGNDYSFYYIEFIDILWMHPTYLSLYLNFGILISYYLYTKNEFNLFKLIFYSSVFILFILLLLARMQILLMFLVLILISIHLLIQNFSLKKIFISFIVLVLSIVFINQNQKIKNRFIYAQNIEYNIESETSSTWNGVNVRLAIWECAFDVIKKNKFIGVGIGDEDDVLFKSYQKKKFKFAFDLKYVAHNQFIQIFLALGIFGIVVYLFIYYVLFKNAFYNKDFLLFSLVIILLFTGFTESFLRLQSGIIFFAYFICLLVYKNSIKKA